MDTSLRIQCEAAHLDCKLKRYRRCSGVASHTHQGQKRVYHVCACCSRSFVEAAQIEELRNSGPRRRWRAAG